MAWKLWTLRRRGLHVERAVLRVRRWWHVRPDGDARAVDVFAIGHTDDACADDACAIARTDCDALSDVRE